MPALPPDVREQIAQRWMQECSDLGEPLALTKQDIRNAVNANDDWRVANAASANQALPLPFRTTANAAQKSRLMTLIIGTAYQQGM